MCSTPLLSWTSVPLPPPPTISHECGSGECVCVFVLFVCVLPVRVCVCAYMRAHVCAHVYAEGRQYE